MRRMYSLQQLEEQVKNQLAEGKVNNVKVFENIVDKDGHKRFIEGDIDLSSNFQEGIAINYKKWSLSGSHLMIVIAGTFANELVISTEDSYFSIILPEWILNKISPSYATNVIEIKSSNAYATDYTTQSIGFVLRKLIGGLQLQFSQTYTFTKERSFRIAFDLIIDNE